MTWHLGTFIGWCLLCWALAYTLCQILDRRAEAKAEKRWHL